MIILGILIGLGIAALLLGAFLLWGIQNCGSILPW